MKRIYFFTIAVIMVLLSLPLSLFSQDSFLYVYTVNEKLKPNLMIAGRSNDEALNEIFKDFSVESYYQSFPSAKTPELLNYYEIHCTCDVDSLENLLKRRNLFEEIYRSYNYDPAAVVQGTVQKPTTGLTVFQNAQMLKIIFYNGGTRHHRVALYNLAGKRQKVSSIYGPDGTISVSLLNVTPGLYILRINDGKNKWGSRILVK